MFSFIKKLFGWEKEKNGILLITITENEIISISSFNLSGIV